MSSRCFKHNCISTFLGRLCVIFSNNFRLTMLDSVEFFIRNSQVKKSLAERLWWVKIILIKYKRRKKRKISKINRAGCSKMLLPLQFKYCLQSRQFLLLFTPSIFLSFLFSSIMFRHIHLWLQFWVAKISDTFEQHHPNPTWWHRQIPCPVYDDNPFQIFLLFCSKNPNRSHESLRYEFALKDFLLLLLEQI